MNQHDIDIDWQITVTICNRNLFKEQLEKLNVKMGHHKEKLMGSHETLAQLKIRRTEISVSISFSTISMLRLRKLTSQAPRGV